MKFSHQNRVVVTGLGPVAPNGIGIEAFWETLVAGRSGIARITRFDASKLKSQIAGEVKDFNPLQFMDQKMKPNRMARHTQFAVAAVAMALRDAMLDPTSPEIRKGVPVITGISTSDFGMIAEGAIAIHEKGPDVASPLVMVESHPQSMAKTIGAYLGSPCQFVTLSTACAAGMDAIGEAYGWITRGKADLVVCGGSDAPISMVPFANFTNAGLCSTRNDEPEKASRPFDLKRDTGVLSEGAGMVVMENLEHALARGASPYMEITGFGVSTDPQLDQPGSGYKFSMGQALANAAKRPEDVDYISAWGPGHPVLDRIETEMIKSVFGKHAYSIPVSSIKGVIGNPLAAAGPLMLIACGLMFRKGLIPPTANYEEPDPQCDLDYVPNHARRANVQCALLNGHGIGGGNSSLVVERIEAA